MTAEPSTQSDVTVTVRNVSGNILWGPESLDPNESFTLDELFDDMPAVAGESAWSEKVTILHKEAVLHTVVKGRGKGKGEGNAANPLFNPFLPPWVAHKGKGRGEDIVNGSLDVSKLPSPVELQVIYDPPAAVNHDFVKEFVWEMDVGMAGDEEIDDLREKFAQRPAYEGISSATIGSEDLMRQLNVCIDRVKSSESVDYHPGSNNIVRDIVHPSMFPYVSGETAVSDGYRPEQFRARPESSRAAKKPRRGGSHEDGFDMWGRPYASSNYQWLPSDVRVDSEGKCIFTSYINNLDRSRHPELYDLLGDLLSESLPHFEKCIGYANAIEFVPNGDEEEVEDLLIDRAELEKPQIQPASLRNKDLQVIVKIVDYEVPAGGTHEGVWHVEGMSHENIVATSELILLKDPALAGGGLDFKRAFTLDEAGFIRGKISQDRSDSVEDLIKEGLVPMGRKALPCGTLAAWPNSHVHRISPLQNTGTEPALRRIVVFWLVHPDRRIVSTSVVPPQQGVMSLDVAHKHRLKLMQERKYEKQDWNVRSISLCEH